MAIYNDFYPLDTYDKGVPEEVKKHLPGICIVAAEGQKFLEKSGLKLKTSGHYYQVSDPQYPEAKGQLRSAEAKETAVWMTGTAFAVARNKFVTAKHVAEDVLNEICSEDPTKLRIVSGYYRKSSDRSSFNYRILKVQSVTYSDKDLAVIITADSLPSTTEPVELATKEEQKRFVENNNLIYMLGYPLGQPQKYTEGTICTTDPKGLDVFKGWISSFPGNSGSPVFSGKNGKVIGVMVSGSPQSDWEETPDSINCSLYQYAKFPNDEDHYVRFLYTDNIPK